MRDTRFFWRNVVPLGSGEHLVGGGVEALITRRFAGDGEPPKVLPVKIVIWIVQVLFAAALVNAGSAKFINSPE